MSRSANVVGMIAQPIELVAIFQQRNLDRFAETDLEITIGQRLQQSGVVDHGPGHRERSDPILFVEVVDRVFDADARIGLRQRGGRQADQANASMSDRSRETDCVQYRTAANRDDVAAAIKIDVVDLMQESARTTSEVFLTSSPPSISKARRPVGRNRRPSIAG